MTIARLLSGYASPHLEGPATMSTVANPEMSFTVRASMLSRARGAVGLGSTYLVLAAHPDNAMIRAVRVNILARFIL